jgi:hypothetical protein
VVLVVLALMCRRLSAVRLFSSRAVAAAQEAQVAVRAAQA